MIDLRTIVKRVNRHRRGLLGGALILALIPLIVDLAMGWSVRVHQSPETLAVHDIGVVLGTSPTVRGLPNRYYDFRLDAAADLYHAGKVNGLLVSGDHGRVEYNEPDAMKRDLVRRGVPAEHITCDYAGFRTLDSVARARSVFGLERIVIISQPFHVERAVYLARRNGMEATAYGAKNPSRRSLLKMRCREVLARNLALWDGLVGTKPKFGGPAIQVAHRGHGV